MITRRRAREIALQALYWVESSGDIEEALQDLSERAKLSQEEMRFPTDICDKCLENKAHFDHLIEAATEHWRLERIARMDRLILRMALTELFFFLDIPPKVTINEAIELARKFSTEKSAQFVNGILDHIATTEGIIGHRSED